MSYKLQYEKWLSSPVLSDGERAELTAISGNEKEIESRFYAPLQFGTAGLRGTLGMGLNRMNRYTVRWATQGIATLICSMGAKTMERGVVVCYDCRIMSKEFSDEVASVLAANGIRVYLFDAMRPTPECSFAIRKLGCIAGINITASHNPKEYNGYKAYWEDGAQLPPAEADVVVAAIEKLDIFTDIKTMPLDDAVKSGLVSYIGREIDEAFLDLSLSLCLSRDAVEAVADDFKIVYTPFHGTGYQLVPEGLRRLGMKHILCEPRQSVPDGTFPTVASPNPQDKEGFVYAIELAKKNDVDLIIGTDPDADRVGIVLRDSEGKYVTLSGNQVGVLLLDYIINALKEKNALPKNAAFVKSIVTTEMARKVAEDNGVACYDTFTGFKYIAEKVGELEESGEGDYILAYEESYGYLVGDGARDKDAITASMLITEMAAWYHLKGMTLYDAMESLYEKYGYYLDETINIVMSGLDGLKRMNALLTSMRENPPREIAGRKVSRFRDYNVGIIHDYEKVLDEKMELSGSNVLYFDMADGTRFVVRPSGTEPKIRVYMFFHGTDKDDCQHLLADYVKAAKELIK